jgi:energy-converting hydrogenase Eha subunit E
MTSEAKQSRGVTTILLEYRDCFALLAMIAFKEIILSTILMYLPFILKSKNFFDLLPKLAS